MKISRVSREEEEEKLIEIKREMTTYEKMLQ